MELVIEGQPLLLSIGSGFYLQHVERSSKDKRSLDSRFLELVYFQLP